MPFDSYFANRMDEDRVTLNAKIGSPIVIEVRTVLHSF
jgi:hypothetical protein